MENEGKEYNEKYICCFFTIWNLQSAIKYKLRRSSAIPYISLFCHQQTHSVIFIVFHVLCIILFNVYFYIVRSMFPFLFNWSQSKASVVNQMSHLFLKLKRYLFALFNFLKMVIFTTLLWRCFQRCFQRCKFQHWLTQRCSNINLTVSDVPTSYHDSNNVETTLKGFLGIEECC